MRKLTYLVVAFAAVAMASCGLKTQPSEASDSDTVCAPLEEPVAESVELKTEKISVTQKKGCWTYKSEAEYPADGPEALVASVRNWISEKLRASENPDETVKAYSGSMDDGKSMLDYYAKKFIASINFDDYAELPEDMECEMDYTFVIEHETPEFVSFGVQTYWFGGGAHGGTTVACTTFLKSDGRQFGWDMIASKKALRPMIIDGLKKYFEVKTDAELMDNLLLAEESVAGKPMTNIIPYPATTPWLSAEGLVLIYQQYEICSYAAGMPIVVIPWNKLKPLLKPEYQSLIAE